MKLVDENILLDFLSDNLPKEKIPVTDFLKNPDKVL
jgi:hypothetical protein